MRRFSCTTRSGPRPQVAVSLMPVVLGLLLAAAGLAQTITTVVGTGALGSGGDNGQATAATLNNPVNLAFGPGGVYYIADQGAHVVRKVSANGVITRFAGTGAGGYNGDDQPAVNAMLNQPTGVAADIYGNVYIVDAGNTRIRKVDTNGTITTIAGTGVPGFSGDGPQPATQMQLQCPVRIAFDSLGVLYVADQCNHRIRKIDGNGMMSTVAGTGPTGPSAGGFNGDGMNALATQFRHPTSIAIDGEGAIFVSDQLNQRIRKIARNGIVSTLATTAQTQGSVAVDSAGNVYFSDHLVHKIYRIDGGQPTFAPTLIVGNGTASSTGDNGPAANATVNVPFGITLDPFGNLYVLESGGHKVRKVADLAPKAPTFSGLGVTNGASFLPGGIQPGSIATIFGTFLANLAGTVTDGGVFPLPTNLQGTTVTVGGFLAPLYAVVNNNGVGQINFQVPFQIGFPALPRALGEAFVEIVVNNNGVSNTPVLAPVTPQLPGIFVVNGFADAQHVTTDNTLVTPQRPAARGEALALYCTGLGVVSNPPGTGTAALDNPLSQMPVFPTVTVGGVQVEAIFGGLAPGYVGLYQVNFVVPQNAPSGTVNITVTLNGVTSAAAPFVVQ
jgi:uncharacterized protein (TIGR03437 family)